MPHFSLCKARGFSGWLLLLALGTWTAERGEAREPLARYLMWQRDPATTMVVIWHSSRASEAIPPDPAPTPPATAPSDQSSESAAETGAPADDEPSIPVAKIATVEYRLMGSEEWILAHGHSLPMPYTDRLVHTVELSRLTPGSEYEFRIPSYGTIERFRTLPRSDAEPIRIIVGGDCSVSPTYAKLCTLAAERDPHLVVLGGDIAYENGSPKAANLVEQWLKIWTERMITSTGRRIPLVAAIGNHEVQGGYGQTMDKAPYFFSVFVRPGLSSYGVLDVGGYLSIFLLDTGHISAIDGAQAQWLARELAARQDTTHVLAAYHVPGYPSFRPYDGEQSRLVREHWTPLFDQYGLDVAFEHHDHTYKRTYPIRGGNVDPQGVLYLGDGCMGQFPRGVKPWHRTWYLAASQSKPHFIEATLHQGQRRYVAIDPTGKVLDRYPSEAATTQTGN